MGAGQTGHRLPADVDLERQQTQVVCACVVLGCVHTAGGWFALSSHPSHLGGTSNTD